ncbi:MULTISPECIES: Crp/Fnr family transcriptional regulator [unclassified Pedobacter]|uniref:Crp/Fnr family transcriptional regulator n=1 Tax=unclassified Pedobacter TaxID=2628915 RepID=UPI001E598DB9|nr:MULTISPECIES: Crp/Fnr family transcriptional regulator [unclassified Pedobacter]
MLRTNPTFLSFAESLLNTAETQKNIMLKDFPAGYKLIVQGDKINNIYIIKDGITKCFITEENGKDFIIEFLGKGEVVGELEALKKIDCLCNVETISKISAFVIPHHYFLSLIDTNVNFTKILLQALSTRIMQTSSRASFQQLYTLEYGLAKLLKLQTEADLEISKEDMAAYLGISVRSLNRTLKQIKINATLNTTEIKTLLEKLI